MKARVLSFIAFVILSAVAPIAAQDPLDLAKVTRAIATYPKLSIFDDVRASIEEGEAVLTGKVTMPVKKQALEERVTRVAGVQRVRNEIEVLPVSRSDDELRHRVARAIYGNSSFWRYAAMANPPIHIVVEHGRVTLTGVVGSNVERALAQSLATGLGELSVTNLLRTEIEARP